MNETQSDWATLLLTVTEIVLASILFASGFGKLVDLGRWQRSIMRYRLRFLQLRFVIYGIPVFELVTGLGLALHLEPAASVLACVMFLAFTGVLIVAMARGGKGECDCFGEMFSLPIGPAAALRAFTLALTAGALSLVGNVGLPSAGHLPYAVGVTLAMLLIGQTRSLSAVGK